ncbi:putative signal peptide protein [Puccinia sorghi]|uniref:Putative signal peptide protein n=1 Tax=Puccinia sorghi TaxID=27349 RepID=A0A0L6UPX6_9BASI|nr:putative signal peptide protein [Puccinia sorghi]
MDEGTISLLILHLGVSECVHVLKNMNYGTQHQVMGIFPWCVPLPEEAKIKKIPFLSSLFIVEAEQAMEAEIHRCLVLSIPGTISTSILVAFILKYNFLKTQIFYPTTTLEAQAHANLVIGKIHGNPFNGGLPINWEILTPVHVFLLFRSYPLIKPHLFSDPPDPSHPIVMEYFKFTKKKQLNTKIHFMNQRHLIRSLLFFALASLGGLVQQLRTYITRGNIFWDPLAVSDLPQNTLFFQSPHPENFYHWKFSLSHQNPHLRAFSSSLRVVAARLPPLASSQSVQVLANCSSTILHLRTAQLSLLSSSLLLQVKLYQVAESFLLSSTFSTVILTSGVVGFIFISVVVVSVFVSVLSVIPSNNQSTVLFIHHQKSRNLSQLLTILYFRKNPTCSLDFPPNQVEKSSTVFTLATYFTFNITYRNTLPKPSIKTHSTTKCTILTWTQYKQSKRPQIPKPDPTLPSSLNDTLEYPVLDDLYIPITRKTLCHEFPQNLYKDSLQLLVVNQIVSNLVTRNTDLVFNQITLIDLFPPLIPFLHHILLAYHCCPSPLHKLSHSCLFFQIFLLSCFNCLIGYKK